jgi:hypothetical protein
MSGGSIWASFECQFCFWIAGGWVSYLTMWILTLQLFKNSTDTQGELRLNLHSLSASELLEYRRIRTVTTYKWNKELRPRGDLYKSIASFFTFFLYPYQRGSTQNWPAYYHCPCLEPLRQDQLSQLCPPGAWGQILTLVSEKPKTTMVADLYIQEIQKLCHHLEPYWIVAFEYIPLVASVPVAMSTNKFGSFSTQWVSCWILSRGLSSFEKSAENKYKKYFFFCKYQIAM